MKRIVKDISISYQYDAARIGAKYSLNGINWMNAGDFCEILAKATLGLGMVKDANTPYNKGSDIPALNASVKSGKATLVNRPMGYSYNEVKTNYFANVHSTCWIWVAMVDNQAILYMMNRDEFETFMDEFGSYCADRWTIRFKATSGKMLQWLDERSGK